MEAKQTWSKIIAMIMALIMCVALIRVPLNAADDPASDIVITTIEVTDFEEPSKGGQPDFEVTIVTKTADGTVVDAVEEYTINWSGYVRAESSRSYDGPIDIDDDIVFGEDVFWDESAYSEKAIPMVAASIFIILKDGYVCAVKEGTRDGFDGSFIVNGKEYNRNTYVAGSGCGNNISFVIDSLYEEEVPVTTVSTIEVTDFEEPSKGGHPDNEVTIVTKTADGTVVDSVSSYSVYWTYRSNDKDLNSSEVDLPADTTFGVDKFWETQNSTEELDPVLYMGIVIVFKDGYVPAGIIDESSHIIDFEGTFTINGTNCEVFYADKMTNSPATVYSGIIYSDIEDLYETQVEPNDPIEPNEPGGSNDPVEPNEPGGTNDPVEPNEPGGTNDPMEPNEPAGSNDPVEPNEPAGSNDPVEPNEPVKPDGTGVDNSFTYAFLEGADSEYALDSEEGLRFRVNGEMKDCTGVEVDNNLLSESDYTLGEGSTIIILSPDLVKKLSVGVHTITALYGTNSVTANFVVKESSDELSKGDSVPGSASANTSTAVQVPSTGERESQYLLIGLVLIVVAGASWVVSNGIKKKMNEE